MIIFEAYLDAAESLSLEAHTKDYRDLLDLLWWETQHNYLCILQDQQQRSDSQRYPLHRESATPQSSEDKDLWYKLFDSLKKFRSRLGKWSSLFHIERDLTWLFALEKTASQSQITFPHDYSPRRISAYSPIELLARCKVYDRTWSNFEDLIQDTRHLPRTQNNKGPEPIQGPPRCLALMCIRDDNGNSFIITGASEAQFREMDILLASKVQRLQAHQGRLTQEEKAVYNKAHDDYRMALLNIDKKRDLKTYIPSAKAIKKVFLANQPIRHCSSFSFGDGPMAISPLNTNNLAGNAKLAHRFNVATISARTVAINTETNEVKDACNRCHLLCLSNQLSGTALDELLKDSQRNRFYKLYRALACAEFITNAHACRLLHPKSGFEIEETHHLCLKYS